MTSPFSREETDAETNVDADRNEQTSFERFEFGFEFAHLLQVVVVILLEIEHFLLGFGDGRSQLAGILLIVKSSGLLLLLFLSLLDDLVGLDAIVFLELGPLRTREILKVVSDLSDGTLKFILVEGRGIDADVRRRQVSQFIHFLFVNRREKRNLFFERLFFVLDLDSSHGLLVEFDEETRDLLVEMFHFIAILLDVGHGVGHQTLQMFEFSLILLESRLEGIDFGFILICPLIDIVGQSLVIDKIKFRSLRSDLSLGLFDRGQIDGLSQIIQRGFVLRLEPI